MRARFGYECSAIGKREKRSVGNGPDTSLDQALQDFCALDKLMPNVTEYVFYIGKIYDAMQDYEKARTYLDKVLEMSTDPDCEYANEAKQILSGPKYASLGEKDEND
ncbi:tetratricopeptide repeat protein [Cooperia oncophora]